MKSAVETLNPTRVKLTVEVPFDELKPSLDAAYKSIAGQINVPGFRKGKVPPRVIDQRVGREAVVAEALNDALPRFYAQAADENKVRPLGQPEVEVTDTPSGADGDLKFNVEVDVRPTLEIPAFDSLEVTVDDIEVTDEDITERLDNLRERFGTLTSVERAAAEGDFISIDLTARIGEEEIDSAKGISHQIGSGRLIDGLDEAVTGHTAGDTVTFTAPLAGGEHAGQDADIVVVVQSVKERELPEADDDFAQLASEFDTLDELKEDLRGQVEQIKRFNQGIQARDLVLEKLLEQTEIPVPQSIVDAEVHSHLEQESRLEDDEHRAEVTEEVTKALKTQFLLDTIVDAQDVQVEQPEIVEYLVSQAQAYGMDPNTFAQALTEGGQFPSVIAEVARRKALAVALESATVKDSAGNVIDLDDLVPAGQDDDEDELASDELAGDEAAGDADDAAAVDDAAGEEPKA